MPLLNVVRVLIFLVTTSINSVFILKNIPSVWANINHVVKVFQGLVFAFLLWQKYAQGSKVTARCSKISKPF